MDFLLIIKTKILSFFIRSISGDYYDNTAKFYTINKIWHNILLDDISGDYIEFGIFKGKSLYHSYKTAKKIKLSDNRIFWGLDSFEGFPIENHNFYKNENFKVSYKKVKNQFKKYKNVRIRKGYFEHILKNKELKDVEKISFAFVDCDIYESSIAVFEYIKKRISNGGFIMIDDYTSIDQKGQALSKSFYEHFEINKNVVIFGYYANGIIFRYIT